MQRATRIAKISLSQLLRCYKFNVNNRLKAK